MIPGQAEYFGFTGSLAYPKAKDRPPSIQWSSVAAKQAAMSALPPIPDILGPKKKGTGTMAGPLSLLA